MRHRTKFREDRSNRSGDMADFRFSKMADACQILSKSLKSGLRYGDLSIFHEGGRPPSWIFKSRKFQLPVRFGGKLYIIVQKIGRTDPEIWPIFDFSRWRPPPSWIFQI